MSEKALHVVKRKTGSKKKKNGCRWTKKVGEWSL